MAQDVTRYGTDFDGKSHLIELVRELEKLDFEWIRLLYLEPEVVTDELISFVANEPKVCKYMDVPLQHVDSGVLRRMNRHTTEESTRELVGKIKGRGITMRTSFISGFPGESAEAHAKLAAFIKEAEIDFAGVFAYSREEGTAADRMRGHLPEDVKLARADELRALETAVIEANSEKRIGRELKVLADGIDYDRQCFVGHTERQTPDVGQRGVFHVRRRSPRRRVLQRADHCARRIDLIGRTV